MRTRRCKTHNKIMHAQVGGAISAALHATSISGQSFRYYLASCGSYHITRMTREQYESQTRR